MTSLLPPLYNPLSFINRSGDKHRIGDGRPLVDAMLGCKLYGLNHLYFAMLDMSIEVFVLEIMD